MWWHRHSCGRDLAASWPWRHRRLEILHSLKDLFSVYVTPRSIRGVNIESRKSTASSRRDGPSGLRLCLRKINVHKKHILQTIHLKFLTDQRQLQFEEFCLSVGPTTSFCWSVLILPCSTNPKKLHKLKPTREPNLETKPESIQNAVT